MTNDTITDLPASWRGHAAELRVTANRLGNCRVGLEALTEATVLETCADEAGEARDRVVAILRHRVCELVHTAHGETARYRRESRFAQAKSAADDLRVILHELGDPGDRSLPKPEGALPLHPRAEAESREFLGLSADALLGKRAVL